MNSKSFSTRLRVISFVLIQAFIFEQLAFANPDLLKPGRLDLDPKPKIKLNIPLSVARLEDAYEASHVSSSKSLPVRQAGFIGDQSDSRQKHAGMTIYLIQDAHTNDSGQINLSKTLDSILGQEKSIQYIFSEAAVGDNTLSFLRQFKPADERQRLALSYLKKGLLHGTEYLDLTSDHHFILWGVEDPGLYVKSLEDYKAVAKERERFQDYLSRVGMAIDTLKPRVLNPLLLAFDQQYQKYQKEELALTDYFEVLMFRAKTLDISLQPYSHLQNLRLLKDKESKIDFTKANQEQFRAVQSLGVEEQKELQELSLGLDKSPFRLTRNEEKEEKAFYTLLEEKLKGRLSDYPELAKYFGYLKLAQTLEAESVLEELKALEGQVFAALTRSADEEALLRCSKNLELLYKLFSLTLTPQEFDEYKAISEDFGITRLTGFLNEKIMGLRNHYERTVFLETGYEDVVQRAEDFYNLTYQRDLHFVEKTLEKMDAESQDKAILITGGFHTSSLKSLLKKKGVSFISITPQVLHETNQKRYENILLGQQFINQAAFPGSLSAATSHMMETYVANGGTLPERKEVRALVINDFSSDLQSKEAIQTYLDDLASGQIKLTKTGARLSQVEDIKDVSEFIKKYRGSTTDTLLPSNPQMADLLFDVNRFTKGKNNPNSPLTQISNLLRYGNFNVQKHQDMLERANQLLTWQPGKPDGLSGAKPASGARLAGKSEKNNYVIGSGFEELEPRITPSGDLSNLLKNYSAYDSGFKGGVSVAATADFNGDGTVDIVTGAGVGTSSHVKVLDGANGNELASFFAYAPEFQGGVKVAVGDVNGDGTSDIITGAGPSAGSHVKVFSGLTQQEIDSFYAFDEAFRGGVNVAAGDVNGDGRADIIVGAGPGAAPHVKVFDGLTRNLIISFFAEDPNFAKGGVSVAAGDVNGDGKADIIVGFGPSSPGAFLVPGVKVFDGATNQLIKNFSPYDPGFKGGTWVASADVNGDGKADVITGAGPGAGAHVKVFDSNTFTIGQTPQELASFFAYNTDFTGGVFVGAGDITGDGKAEIITGPGQGLSPDVRVYGELFDKTVDVETKQISSTPPLVDNIIYTYTTQLFAKETIARVIFHAPATRPITYTVNTNSDTIEVVYYGSGYQNPITNYSKSQDPTKYQQILTHVIDLTTTAFNIQTDPAKKADIQKVIDALYQALGLTINVETKQISSTPPLVDNVIYSYTTQLFSHGNIARVIFQPPATRPMTFTVNISSHTIERIYDGSGYQSSITNYSKSQDPTKYQQILTHVIDLTTTAFNIQTDPAKKADIQIVIDKLNQAGARLAAQKPTAKLQIEQLEDRTAPATGIGQQSVLSDLAKPLADQAQIGVLNPGVVSQPRAVQQAGESQSQVSPAAFVTSLYNSILDREPDQDGFANWAKVLLTGQLTREQIITEFFNSTEYKVSQTSPEAFVTALYKSILNRQPDAPGFDNWTGLLTSGKLTRDQVLTEFLNSPEYRIRALYLEVLQREPDAEGQGNWINQFNSLLSSGLSSQASLDQIRTAFTQSDEYKQLTANDFSVTVKNHLSGTTTITKTGNILTAINEHDAALTGRAGIFSFSLNISAKEITFVNTEPDPDFTKVTDPGNFPYEYLYTFRGQMLNLLESANIKAVTDNPLSDVQKIDTAISIINQVLDASNYVKTRLYTLPDGQFNDVVTAIYQGNLVEVSYGGLGSSSASYVLNPQSQVVEYQRFRSPVQVAYSTNPDGYRNGITEMKDWAVKALNVQTDPAKKADIQKIIDKLNQAGARLAQGESERKAESFVKRHRNKILLATLAVTLMTPFAFFWMSYYLNPPAVPVHSDLRRALDFSANRLLGRWVKAEEGKFIDRDTDGNVVYERKIFDKIGRYVVMKETLNPLGELLRREIPLKAGTIIIEYVQDGKTISKIKYIKKDPDGTDVEIKDPEEIKKILEEVDEFLGSAGVGQLSISSIAPGSLVHGGDSSTPAARGARLAVDPDQIHIDDVRYFINKYRGTSDPQIILANPLLMENELMANTFNHVNEMTTAKDKSTTSLKQISLLLRDGKFNIQTHQSLLESAHKFMTSQFGKPSGPTSGAQLASGARLASTRRIAGNRIWTEEEIEGLLGEVNEKHALQNFLADKFFNTLQEMQDTQSFIATGGVMDGPSAAAMAEAGHKALYFSGWQASHHWGQPDLAKYPLDTVSNKIKEIYKFLKNKHDDQQIRFKKMKVGLEKVFYEMFKAIHQAPQEEMPEIKEKFMKKFLAVATKDIDVFLNQTRDNPDVFLGGLFEKILSQAIDQKGDSSQEKRDALREAAAAALRSQLVDYLIPIFADGDTGHQSVKEMVRLFVDANAAAIHIEDQAHGDKKCGHMAGKKLVSSMAQVRRLLEAKKEAKKLGSGIVIVARTDAEAAKLLQSNEDPSNQYFIMGSTVKNLLSLSYLIRLSRREVSEYDNRADNEGIIAEMKEAMPGINEAELRDLLSKKTPEQLVEGLGKRFPDLADGIKEIWRLRGEVNGKRLEPNELFGIRDEKIAVDDIWKRREAVEFGEDSLTQDTVLEDETGGKMTVREILERKPANIDEEIAATYKLSDLWGQKAQLKTYTQAVSEAIMQTDNPNKEKIKESWEKATDPLKNILSIGQMRALAKNLGIKIDWDWEMARTYDGDYQVDRRLGLLSASVRAIDYVVKGDADVVWMEQEKPDVKQAAQFIQNVKEGLKARGVSKRVFFAINLSPSFNWSHPDNWKSSLTTEQIANIKTAMALPGFDWKNTASWGEYEKDVQAMVDAIMNFSFEMGKLGFVFQFVTIFQDHVSTHAIYKAAMKLKESGAGGFVRSVQQEEQKDRSRFVKHQTAAGVTRVEAEDNLVLRGASATGAGGKDSTEHQFAKPTAAKKKRAPGVTIRRDILKAYPDIFGDKKVNGRDLNVESLITDFTKNFEQQFAEVLSSRREFQRKVAEGTAKYSFLDENRKIQDADGNTLTVRDIRQGMFDNAFGRKTKVAWKLGPTVGIPDHVKVPGLQGTGPADDLGMAMSAINAHTASWMWDWEDAGNDYQDKFYQAWRNLKLLLAGEATEFEHPTKKNPDGTPKKYRINFPKNEWPVIFHRVAGLHLKNRQISYRGQQVPGIIPALVIHTLNNYDSLKKDGRGVYFYIPKIETPQEALLVSKILKALEEAIGVPRGTIKIEMLNERGRYPANQEAIMWVLRENLIGPNVGRWDYINGRIEMVKDDPKMVFPDPHTVGMTDPTMTEYTRRNALLTLLVGGFPVGGMSAVMEKPGAPKEVNDKAVRSIWFDKLRERLTGLLEINGKLHDAYRQSWVATTAETYVRAGEEPLRSDLNELQGLVERTTADERARLEKLGLVDKDGKITPYVVSEEYLKNLFSKEAWHKLFRRPEGGITEEGLRYAIYMASEYMFQQLNGNNAAAIEDYMTGNRLMNDFATYEIFWHWLWTAVHHQVALTKDGKTTEAGEHVTPELMDRLLAERDQAVEDFFKKQEAEGKTSMFDKRLAPLVMDILKRQLHHPKWITYGSRVLLSLIEKDVEKDKAEIDAILEAIFSESREDVVYRVQFAETEERHELFEKALAAYDFVYDVFPDTTGARLAVLQRLDGDDLNGTFRNYALDHDASLDEILKEIKAVEGKDVTGLMAQRPGEKRSLPVDTQKTDDVFVAGTLVTASFSGARLAAGDKSLLQRMQRVIDKYIEAVGIIVVAPFYGALGAFFLAIALSTPPTWVALAIGGSVTGTIGLVVSPKFVQPHKEEKAPAQKTITPSKPKATVRPQASKTTVRPQAPKSTVGSQTQEVHLANYRLTVNADGQILIDLPPGVLKMNGVPTNHIRISDTDGLLKTKGFIQKKGYTFRLKKQSEGWGRLTIETKTKALVFLLEPDDMREFMDSGWKEQLAPEPVPAELFSDSDVIDDGTRVAGARLAVSQGKGKDAEVLATVDKLVKTGRYNDRIIFDVVSAPLVFKIQAQKNGQSISLPESSREHEVFTHYDPQLGDYIFIKGIAGARLADGPKEIFDKRLEEALNAGDLAKLTEITKENLQGAMDFYLDNLREKGVAQTKRDLLQRAIWDVKNPKSVQIPSIAPKDIPTAGARFAEVKEFFAGVSDALGVKALDNKSLAIGADKPYLFELSVVDGRLVAEARDFRIVLDSSRKGPKSSPLAEKEQSPTLSDLRRLHDALVNKVNASLGQVTVSNNQTVVNVINLDLINNESFDFYLAHYVSEIRFARKQSYGKNVFFQITGRPDLVERALANPEARELFLTELPPGLENITKVNITSASSLTQGFVNIPVSSVKEGEVPAFRSIIKLAIYSGRMDLSNIPQGFQDAYTTLAGVRPESQTLKDILEGKADPDTALRFALRAITKVPINQAIKFFEMMKRMVEQAA